MTAASKSSSSSYLAAPQVRLSSHAAGRAARGAPQNQAPRKRPGSSRKDRQAACSTCRQGIRLAAPTPAFFISTSPNESLYRTSADKGAVNGSDQSASRPVSVLATISPETASKPICNLCHEQRFVIPCFSTSHSPGPFSFRPGLSTINCRGPPPQRRQHPHDSV
jgi:hypothetical protein